ncbi:hypothetical protein BC834DRAFT_881822 [Gloeopeniophorella convolvens]|nr:hypothetical protein BC834DRAFT_881822 [Gloeopeniophorella convolvens]
MAYLSTLLSPFARFPRLGASDPESQPERVSFSGLRMVVHLPEPIPLRTRAWRAVPITSEAGDADTRNALAGDTLHTPSLTRNEVVSRRAESFPHNVPPFYFDVPPPYEEAISALTHTSLEEEAPPSYSEHPGPCGGGNTSFMLAEFFFKCGFLFPPLWFFSAFLLFFPLVLPPDWEPYRSPAERAALLRQIRAAELLWIRRGVCAAFILSSMISVAVVLSVEATRSG